MAGVWVGRDWQEYCISLLQRRYATTNPHALQLVPDRHNGDLGLEAFSHDGHAYQCYAAQEPLTTKQCYEKQRDKLTTDLGKLQARSSDVGALLGNVVIRRYVYLVHRHDSRQLITHAQSKSSDVVGWRLPFISDEFCVVIETDDDYRNEREDILAVPQALVDPVTPTPNDIAEWIGGNASLRDTAVEKLSRIEPSANTIEVVVSALLNQYLQGENALEQLKQSVPEGFASVLKTKSHKEDLLVLQHPPTTANSTTRLSTIATELVDELRLAYPLLDKQLAETLAWSTVAEWLMRCPLDFGDSDV